MPPIFSPVPFWKVTVLSLLACIWTIYFYFSTDPAVEAAFEHGLKHTLNMGVNFESDSQYFLGLKMECYRDNDNHMDIFLSLETFIDHLLVTWVGHIII